MLKTFGNGRLTRDPEISYVQQQNGSTLATAKFILASKRSYVKEGQQDTDFIPCVVFGNQAKLVESMLVQGSKILFIARPTSSDYVDKNGEKRYTVQFVIESWEFDESKSESEARRQRQNQQQGNNQAQGNNRKQANQKLGQIDPDNLGFY